MRKHLILLTLIIASLSFSNIDMTQAQMDSKANLDATNIDVNAWKEKLGVTNGGNTQYIDKDATNVNGTNKGTITTNLSNNANFNTPTNSLVTDTKLKQELDNKLNSDLSNLDTNNLGNTFKNDLTNLVNDRIPKGNVVSNTLTITDGTGRIFGTDDLRLEVNQDFLDTIDTKQDKDEYLTTNQNFVNTLNNKVDKNGDNLNVRTTDPNGNIVIDVNASNTLKQTFRDNIGVYSKSDVDSKVYNSSRGNIDPNNTTTGINAGTLKDYTDNNFVSKNDLQSFYDKINDSTKNLPNVSKSIRDLENGVTIGVAMANIPQVTDNQNVNIGLGLGRYEEKTGLAIGVTGKNKNTNFVYKASAGISQSNVGYGLGLAVGFSPKDKKTKDLIEKNIELKQRLRQVENKVSMLEKGVN